MGGLHSDRQKNTTSIFERKYIYDAVQRLLHWWLALSTLSLIITGLVASNQDPGSQQAFTWILHMGAGKILVLGLVGRLVWGLIGPLHARLGSFIHPTAWISSLKTRKILSADADFGHHPQASISYLGLYALLIAMSATGLMLAAILHGEGPLADRLLDHFTYVDAIRFVHEYGWWTIAFFIATHIGALVFHEWHDRIPIAQSMISGFQYRTKKKENSDGPK